MQSQLEKMKPLKDKPVDVDTGRAQDISRQTIARFLPVCKTAESLTGAYFVLHIIYT